jgi:putative ABC transport system substrate-binding protein
MRNTTARFCLVASVAGVLALSACTSSEGSGSESNGETQTIHIGINQLVTHPSLDAAVKGFKQAFADAGWKKDRVTFDVQNAQGDQSTATTIASKFVQDGDDMILAVGTPSAQASAQASLDVPILFTAVTDPLAAGLVKSLKKPGSNVTGVSSLNPVKEQLGLITEVSPDAKTVGVIYSSGEVNSKVQLKIARQVAPGLGLKLKEVTVTNSSEVAQAADSLGDVDAIYVPADNTVVSALDSVLQTAEAKSIPVFTADSASVEAGGVATYGIDYVALGHQTGEMALRILDGKNPADTPVEELETAQLIVNPAAAKRMGVTIPQTLLSKAGDVVK